MHHFASLGSDFGMATFVAGFIAGRSIAASLGVRGPGLEPAFSCWLMATASLDVCSLATVVGFDVGMKLRRLSHLLFQKTLNRSFATEDFRASLERIWEKEIVR